jgi:hypothetical protein
MLEMTKKTKSAKYDEVREGKRRKETKNKMTLKVVSSKQRKGPK